MIRRSLAEVAYAIRCGDVTARMMVEQCLRRAAGLQKNLNCFIDIEAERALAMAEEVDVAITSGRPAGPLSGVPVAHKDIFRRIGRTMSCGSRILCDSPPEQGMTATAVKRLEAAGAITLGRLNLAEFAVGPIGENRTFGDCRNPWSVDHAPGGSSSGSAAAVAAGLVFGSLCSDTGGSARLPAAMCGVVGLKVTNSAVSRHGMMGLARSLDTVGIIAPTARDAAMLLAVVSGPDPSDSSCSSRPAFQSFVQPSQRLDGLRIGIPRNYYWEDMAPEIADSLARGISELQQLGAGTVDVTIPYHNIIPALAGIVFASEAATVHAQWIRDRTHEYSEEVLERLEPGLCIPAHRYLEALHHRSRITTELVTEVFRQVDVLFTPVVRVRTPVFAELASLSMSAKLELISTLTHCTRPINYLGLPALSAPCGFTSDGLPIGCQLVGRPFAEDLLLAVAEALETTGIGLNKNPVGESVS